ncbi:MAG: hypothetical protein Q7T30_04595, partial [Planctomycetota bacterium]|nr:hypothetical protein [Planctomycetota bacterium]
VVAVLVACTPAVGYFATIVELQALVMAVTGISVWAFVALGQRQALWRAAALGVVTAIAAAVHSSCHVLVVAWWLFAMTSLWPKTAMGRVCTLLTMATVAHAATFMALNAALAPPTDVVGKSAGMLASIPAAAELVRGCVHRAIWEFVIPFAPSSVLLCSLVFLRGRAGCGGLLLAALVGLAMTMLLVTDATVEERGAYLLPMAIPLAVFTVQRTSPRSWVWLAVAGVLVTLVLRLDQAAARPCRADVAKGALQLEADAPRLFLSGSHLVLDSIAAHAPDLRCLQATDLHLHGSADPGQAAAFIARAFDDLVAGIRPRTVVVDEQTFLEWQKGPWPEMRSLVTEHLPAAYRTTAVEAAGFRGYSIVHK